MSASRNIVSFDLFAVHDICSILVGTKFLLPRSSIFCSSFELSSIHQDESNIARQDSSVDVDGDVFSIS